jgi:hypothetical protein
MFANTDIEGFSLGRRHPNRLYGPPSSSSRLRKRLRRNHQVMAAAGA